MIAYLGSERVSEVWKSMRYRTEPERIQRNGSGLVFRGDNHEHHLSFSQDSFWCDCESFKRLGDCSHTKTVEWLEANTNVRFRPEAQAH